MSTSGDLGLRLSFLSDWHVGSGAGRYGLFDSLVARDDEGLPFLPSSTLRGMMRDACEHAARALGEDSGWPEFCLALFGDEPSRWTKGSSLAMSAQPPRPGRIAVSAGRLSTALRGRIGVLEPPDRERIRQAMTFARPGVAIERSSGQAKEDFLRFDEVARRGLVLDAEIAVDVPPQVREVTLAFLQAGTFLLDRVGGNRRRGLGRVEVTTAQHGAEGGAWAARVLSETSQAPDLARAAGEAQRAAPERASGSGLTEELVDIPFKIHLLAPTLVGGRVEANVVTGADHLPGSVLLPAIRRRLEAAGVPDVSDLIASGRLRVSPALPEVAGSCALPVPATWRVHKEPPDDVGKEVVDILAMLHTDAGSHAAEGRGQNRQLKRLSGTFCLIEGTGVRPVRPQFMLATHNTIDDEVQRPTAQVGGVYVYEALAPDQVFAGVLSIPASLPGSLQPDWRDVAAGTIRLGRARGAGYGSARLSFGEPAFEQTDDTASRRPDGAADIVLLFESDTLLHSGMLTPGVCERDVTAAIREALGPDAASGLRSVHCALRPAVTQSWSVAWGLPRPDLLGIGAGSVMRLRFDTEPPWNALDDLTRSGLGLRRAEGFGRLHLLSVKAVNATDEGVGPEATGFHLTGAEEHLPVNAAEAAPLDEAETALAKMLEDTACRAVVLEDIERLLVDAARFQVLMGFEAGADTPTMSQLGSLRDALTTRLGDPPAAFRKRMRSFLAKRRNHSKVAERWGKTSLDALSALFADAPAVDIWDRLDGPSGGRAGPPALVSTVSEVRQRIEPWALRQTLLAAIRFHKRELEKKAEGDTQLDRALPRGGR